MLRLNATAQSRGSSRRSAGPTGQRSSAPGPSALSQALRHTPYRVNTSQALVAFKSSKRLSAQNRQYTTTSTPLFTNKSNGATAPPPKPSEAQGPAIPRPPKPISLALALKKLAVFAHPDLFQKYPKESKANDTSFKELRHYLEEVRRVIDVDPEAIDREKENKNAFKLVHAKKQLAPLFADAGVVGELDLMNYFDRKPSGPDDVPAPQAIFKYSSYLTSVKKPGTPTFKKFAELRKEATEAVATIHKRIAGAHGVVVRSELSPFVYKTTAELWKQYIEALKKLEATLNQVVAEAASTPAFKPKADLKGLEVVITADRRGLTQTGALCVDFNVSSDWARLIVSESSVQKRQHTVEQARLRKEREAHLAKELGFLEIIPHHNIATSTEYTNWLKEVQGMVIRNPKKWRLPDKSVNKLKIKVMPANSVEYDPLDCITGCAAVTLDSDIPEVYDFLLQHGAMLIKDMADLKGARQTIVADFGLKSLHIQPGISSDNVISCLNRMAKASQLRQFTQNLNLCIASQYGVDEDQGLVYLSHSFR